MSNAIRLICQNPNDDRVIPRFARVLRDGLGWQLSDKADSRGLNYLSGWFELNRLPRIKDFFAYFTHYEPGPKGKAFLAAAKRARARVVTAPMYHDMLVEYGPTYLIDPPLDLSNFYLREGQRSGLGFAGFTYVSGRKGETLAQSAIAANPHETFKAIGRGWPVETKRLSWADVGDWYAGLDALIITATIEGVPMPPLEAMACGTSIIIPRGVGLLDTLPDMPGVVRYDCGNSDSLNAAIADFRSMDIGALEREELSAYAGQRFNPAAWVNGHKEVVESLTRHNYAPPLPKPDLHTAKLQRGIYIVAYGGPAREEAKKLIASCRQHIPHIPIAVAATTPVADEEFNIELPDADVGARIAKLRAHEVTPFENTLYLDADTEVISDEILLYFKIVEDGFDLVIATDPPKHQRLSTFRNYANSAEMEHLRAEHGDLNVLQMNGGVWAFRKDTTAGFFKAWRNRWEVFGKKDQGALSLALRDCPLRVFVLGNEYNYFTLPQHRTPGVSPVALLHTPGNARRWQGAINARLDSAEAWRAVAS